MLIFNSNAKIGVDHGAAGNGVREERGYQVGVTVVDRWSATGLSENRFAVARDTSRRKVDAVSFRTSTSVLAEQTKAEAMHLPYMLDHALPLGGDWCHSGEGSIVAGSVFRCPRPRIG